MVARTTAKTGSEDLTARIVQVEAFNSTHIEYKAKMTGDSLQEMVQCGKTSCPSRQERKSYISYRNTGTAAGTGNFKKSRKVGSLLKYLIGVVVSSHSRGRKLTICASDGLI